MMHRSVPTLLFTIPIQEDVPPQAPSRLADDMIEVSDSAWRRRRATASAQCL